jgi:hypothetical protein
MVIWQDFEATGKIRNVIQGVGIYMCGPVQELPFIGGCYKQE